MRLKHRFVQSRDPDTVQLLYLLDKLQDPLAFHADPKSFSQARDAQDDIFKQQTIAPSPGQPTDEPFYMSAPVASKQLSALQIQNKRALLIAKMQQDARGPGPGAQTDAAKDVLTVKYTKSRGRVSQGGFPGDGGRGPGEGPAARDVQFVPSDIAERGDFDIKSRKRKS